MCHGHGMLTSQLCSRYFQEHHPYICHNMLCSVKWLRSMPMLRLQLLIYCRVSLCLEPLHIKQLILKLCNKGTDVTFTALFSLRRRRSHSMYTTVLTPECLSNIQNHVLADTSRFWKWIWIFSMLWSQNKVATRHGILLVKSVPEPCHSWSMKIFALHSAGRRSANEKSWNGGPFCSAKR